MGDPPALAARLAALFDELVARQERRALGLGAALVPAIAWEDLHNFDDLPPLARDPGFTYEAGALSGMLAARAAVLALLADRGDG